MTIPPPTEITLLSYLFNEESAVPRLVEALRGAAETFTEEGHTVEIVLVDDGSTDRSAALLEAALPSLPGARLLRHQANRGVGAALRTGYLAARGEILVSWPGESAFPAGQIPQLARRLATGEADLLIASYNHPDSRITGVPLHRLLLSRGASLAYRIALGFPPLHTLSCGFRALRGELARRCFPAADGFLGNTEVTVRALLAGYRVAEVPTRLAGRAATGGTSKMRILRTAAAHLGLLLRTCLARGSLRRPA